MQLAQGPPQDGWHALLNESGAPVQGKDGPAQVLLHTSYRWGIPSTVVVKQADADKGTLQSDEALQREVKWLSTRLRQEEDLVAQLRKTVAQEREENDSLRNNKMQDANEAQEKRMDECMAENKRLAADLEQVNEALKKEKQDGFWREAAKKSDATYMQQIQDLRSEMSALENSSSALQKDKDGLQRDVLSLRKENDLLKNKVDALMDEIQGEKKRLQCVSRERETLQQEKKSLEEQNKVLCAQAGDMRRAKETAEQECARLAQQVKELEKKSAVAATMEAEMTRVKQRQREQEVEIQREIQEGRRALKATQELLAEEKRVCETLQVELQREKAQVEGLEWRLHNAEQDLGVCREQFDKYKDEMKHIVQQERATWQQALYSADALSLKERQMDVLKERVEKERVSGEKYREAERGYKNEIRELKEHLVTERDRLVSLRISYAQEQECVKQLQSAMQKGNESAAGLRVSCACACAICMYVFMHICICIGAEMLERHFSWLQKLS